MELIIALLMIVNGEIKEHRIQETMSECLSWYFAIKLNLKRKTSVIISFEKLL